MDEKKIEEIFKPTKFRIVQAVIMIIISLIMYIWFFVGNLKTQEKPEAINYYDLIESKDDKENIYAKVRVTDISKFTSKRMLNDYYYIKDDKGHILIAELHEKIANQIIEKYNNEDGEFYYDLEGYLFPIEEFEKQIIISQVKNYFNDAPNVTEENYESYFGKTYISTTIPYILAVHNFGIIFGVLLDLMAVSFLIEYFLSKIFMEKYLKKFNVSAIKNELKEDSTKVFDKEKVYLTDNYIVYREEEILKITRYQELLWIYIIENTNLVGRTTNQHYIPVFLGTSQDKNKLEEIIDLIKEKNQDILVGYSKENKKAYKNYWKKIKLGR